MDRRDFIKLTAITGTSATLASCGSPVNVRVMEADVETTRNGQAGVVKMGVAKKLEGLATDPISRGGLCARGQASIQITYHPDRLTQPMKRSGARGSGDFTAVTWDEALAELAGHLDALAAARDQKSLAYLTRRRSSRRTAVAAEFLSKFGAPAPLVFDVFGDQVLRQANQLSFGHAQLPTIDLARSRFVISFGAERDHEAR